MPIQSAKAEKRIGTFLFTMFKKYKIPLLAIFLELFIDQFIKIYIKVNYPLGEVTRSPAIGSFYILQKTREWLLDWSLVATMEN